MDSRQLRYFVAVAEHGSFTRASAQLHIAQPALSRHVGNLEAELRVKLLDRAGRRTTLTTEGRLLHDRARSLLKGMDTIRAELQSFGGSPSGSVTLGITPTVTRLLLAPLIKVCRIRHPNIVVRVVEGFDSGGLEEMLLHRQIDLAILYIHGPSRRLSYTAVLDEELLLVGEPESVRGLAPIGILPASDIQLLPLILPSRPHGLRLYLDRLLGLHLNVVSEANALHPLVELAKAGTGFTVLPLSAVPWEIEYGVLASRRLKQPSLRRQIALAQAGDRAPTSAERALAELIPQEIRRLVEMNHWKAKFIYRGGASGRRQ